ncbi:MAG: protein kinase [Sandaracinus sp.]
MTAAVSAGASGTGLAPGQVVGGRFELVEPASEDALGAVWKARDQKTKKGIALRVLAPSLFATPADLEALRAELKVASALMHRNVVTTFGMGGEKTGARFVACEWLDGKTVAELRSAPRMSLAQIVDVVSQLCEGLSVLHVKKACHGAVRTSVVWVAGGKVKLADIGIARALLKTAGPAALGPAEQLSLAPEVRASGAAATVASDVFGIGGVIYALTTGRSPTDDFVPPSSAHPEGSPELDQILLRCLSADPAARYQSAMEVKRALGNLIGIDASVEIDIDVDKPKSIAPGPGPAMPRPAAGEAPQVGQRVSIHEEFRPSLVGAAPAPEQASAVVDLGKIISKITENDAARWMAQKDGLDHGPFSGRELVSLIAKGEVLGDHALLNMDTGERRKVREYPEFLEFVEQYKLKAHAEAEKVAIVESAKTEKASNTAKFVIAAAVLGVVGIVLVVFFLTRGAEQSHEVAGGQLADLYERGDIQIEGTAGILPDPPRTGGGHHGPRRAGGGGAGTSYEEAMSQVVDMGSAAGSGGEGRLSPAQVAGVMNGRINAFFPCVGAELRSGGSLGRVRINMAIAGNGSVLGSSVDAGSPAFQSCVQRVVAGTHFPSFGAPRMGASFSFDASQ